MALAQTIYVPGNNRAFHRIIWSLILCSVHRNRLQKILLRVNLIYVSNDGYIEIKRKIDEDSYHYPDTDPGACSRYHHEEDGRNGGDANMDRCNRAPGADGDPVHGLKNRIR